MTTWGELRSEIREDIADAGAREKYSDTLLYTYFKDAIRDYSTYFPIRVDREELTGSGKGPYTLPDALVNILFVECPEDRYLEYRLAHPGARYPKTTGQPFFFFVDGGSLYMDGSPISGDTVLMTYEAVHTLPEDAIPEEDDDATIDDAILTVPTQDEELLRLYVKAKVYELVRTKTARLDRFREDERDQNPVVQEVRNLMRDYHQKIAERYRGGAIMLHRQGRTR